MDERRPTILCVDDDAGVLEILEKYLTAQGFCVVTATNGVTNSNLVWKDTVLVQKGDTVEVLVDMENPGTWLIHCHIPEHMEAGMMSSFKVI